MTEQEYAFCGVRIRESVYLTEAGDPITVRRTWKERLWSRPWRPWVSSRIVIPQVPMRGGYQCLDGSVLMHPATVRALKYTLGQKISANPQPASGEEPQ